MVRRRLFPPLHFMTRCLYFMLHSTGESMLSLNVPKEQMYPMKLKGISVCFQMLKQILSGNYVNFGVFKLYGDNALDNVLNMTAKLILTIPHDDILVNIMGREYFECETKNVYFPYRFIRSCRYRTTHSYSA